jgi:hypothetical protein
MDTTCVTSTSIIIKAKPPLTTCLLAAAAGCRYLPD